MSSANRSSFTPARGGSSQGGTLASIPTTKVSARDLPSQKALKRRQPSVVKQQLASDLASDISISAIPTLDNATNFASLIKLDQNLAQFAEQDRDAESDDDEEEAEFSSKRIRPQPTSDSSSGDDSDEELQQELQALRKERLLAVRLILQN